MISRRAFLLPGLSLCLPLAGCIVAGADLGVGHPAGRKAIQRGRHPRSCPDHLRRLDRDSVVGSAGSDGRGRKTRGGHCRRGGHRCPEQPGRQSRDRRGEAPSRPQLELVRTPSARLVVSVPEAANVRASSGDGAIRVSHVNGTIKLRSGDGRIQASNSSGSVSASTSDGVSTSTAWTVPWKPRRGMAGSGCPAS